MCVWLFLFSSYILMNVFIQAGLSNKFSLQLHSCWNLRNKTRWRDGIVTFINFEEHIFFPPEPCFAKASLPKRSLKHYKVWLWTNSVANSLNHVENYISIHHGDTDELGADVPSKWCTESTYSLNFFMSTLAPIQKCLWVFVNVSVYAGVFCIAVQLSFEMFNGLCWGWCPVYTLELYLTTVLHLYVIIWSNLGFHAPFGLLTALSRFLLFYFSWM